MAKSKLELAIERHAGSLNDAQRELVMSQFSVYKQNKAKMAALKSQQAVVEAFKATSLEEVRVKQANRSSLAYEYNQLATANSRIAAELFEFMKE